MKRLNDEVTSHFTRLTATSTRLIAAATNASSRWESQGELR